MATYSEIARAFISGLRVPAPSKTINGRKRLYADLFNADPDAMFSVLNDALFSYGPHFPALIRSYEGGCHAAPTYLLNESKYYPTDGERDAAGFQQSYYSTRDRSKMPSPTTRRQLDNIALELRRAGFAATDETRGIAGYDYRVWSKVDALVEAARNAIELNDGIYGGWSE